MRKSILAFIFIAFISCGSSEPDESDAKQAARSAILQNLKKYSTTHYCVCLLGELPFLLSLGSEAMV